MQDKRLGKLLKIVEQLEKQEYKSGWLKLKINDDGFISEAIFEKKLNIFKGDCK